MKTRFDNYGVWVTATGEIRNVSDMDTSHILNTMRMLIQKPSRTIGMLIHDVENSEVSSLSVWEPNFKVTVKQSICNITSMTVDELKAYVKRTPLFQSMFSECVKRGVNMDNILSILETCDSF